MHLRNIRNNEFAIKSSGSGMPFIWGHGLMSCMDVDDEAPLLNWSRLEEMVRVIRYDARGHGDSAGSTEPKDYLWQQQALDVWAIADEYAPGEKVILGGASMGCAVSLHAAMLHPERVAGMVLLIPPTAWDTRPRQSKLYRRLSRIIGVVGRVSKVIVAMLGPERHGGSVKKTMGIAVARHLARAHPPYLRNALLGAADSDLPRAHDLDQLDVPAIVLTWTGDRGHPVSTARVLNAHLPDVRLFQVSNDDELDDWTGYVENLLLQIKASEQNDPQSSSDC